MKPGDLVRREGYSIYLYDSPELTTPAPILMEQMETIATVLETIPAKYTLRGKLVAQEKIKLLHPSGRFGWSYSSHYTTIG